MLLLLVAGLEAVVCCDPLGEQCSNGAACECVSAKRRLLFGSIPKDGCSCAAPTANPPTKRKYNVLWMLIDDVSIERFPESGNTALEGLLPGFDELKSDGAIFYDHLYAPSSICAPAQASVFSGMDPARIGAQHQFAGDNIEGLRKYKSTPPPEVEFMPEILRQEGYWSTGAGKLDYQVGDVSAASPCGLVSVDSVRDSTHAIRQHSQVIPTFCALARSNVPPLVVPAGSALLRLPRARLVALGRAQQRSQGERPAHGTSLGGHPLP